MTDFDGVSQVMGATNIVRVSFDQYPGSVKLQSSKAELLVSREEEGKREESESMVLSPSRQAHLQTIDERDEKLPQTTTEI